MNLEWCLYFEHKIQSHCEHVFLMSVPDCKPWHIPLKNGTSVLGASKYCFLSLLLFVVVVDAKAIQSEVVEVGTWHYASAPSPPLPKTSCGWYGVGRC